jgi:predicted NBD/HSP70 family sugar kinase
MLVDELTSDGIVIERLPLGRDGPGRPSPLVIPRPDALVVLAVDIRVDEVVVGMMGIGGHLFARKQWDLRGGHSVRQVVADIVDHARPLLDQSPHPVHGVGVAVPGIVRLDDGVVHEAPNLSWTNVALRERFKAELRLNTDLGNDAELGALAESTRGVARGAHDMAYVFADVGVGGGVISRGSSLLGARSHVGEFGHMAVNTEGTVCYCGCRGCWETEIGRVALARALDFPDSSSRDAVVAALREISSDSALTQRLLGGVSKWLAIGLCNLVNLLGSDLIVLGGLLAELPAEIVVQVQQTVRRQSIVGRAFREVKVVASSLGADAPLVGAAELAFQRVLADPFPTARLGTIAPPPSTASPGDRRVPSTRS